MNSNHAEISARQLKGMIGLLALLHVLASMCLKYDNAMLPRVAWGSIFFEEFLSLTIHMNVVKLYSFTCI